MQANEDQLKVRTIPYYHIHDDNNDDNKNKTSWLYKSSSNSVPVMLMPISYRKHERRRSGAYAEQEQCAPIVLSYWQRSSRAAEPWLVLQYRQVSSFLSYFPAFSSKHCVPCALMRNRIKLNWLWKSFKLKLTGSRVLPWLFDHIITCNMSVPYPNQEWMTISTGIAKNTAEKDRERLFTSVAHLRFSHSHICSAYFDL